MQRLSMKGKSFEIFTSASEAETRQLKPRLKNLIRLNNFLKTHCKETHYAFLVKKCRNGYDTCNPWRDERSKELSFLPEPIRKENGHYKGFNEVYGTLTEDSRPSLTARSSSNKKKMLYSPSIQHAKNTNLMVQCEECSKWRLIFAIIKILLTI